MTTHTYPKRATRARKNAVRESPASNARESLAWRAIDEPHRNTGLLMDTHVWLWILVDEPRSISHTVRGLVARAAETSQLFVSDISYWELAMLVSKGRRELPMGIDHFLAVSANAPGITYVGVDRNTLVDSTKLPGKPHNDPADRILIAHARSLGASLLTRDKDIINYAKRTPGIPVCDARG